MKESSLQGRILTALRRRGGKWDKRHQDALSGDGRPDIDGCFRGFYVAFEVKVPGHSTAKSRLRLQQLNINEIQDCGGVAAFVESVPQALAVLETIDIWLNKHSFVAQFRTAISSSVTSNIAVGRNTADVTGTTDAASLRPKRKRVC